MYQVVLINANEGIETAYFDFYETAVDYADGALERGYSSAEIYKF